MAETVPLPNPVTLLANALHRRMAARYTINGGSSNSLTTDQAFTGQKYDNSGLQFFNARYYDPQIGQFISPDTLVPDPSLVIDYNRYAFGRGNPLRYSDPTGHYSDDEIMTHFGCGSDWSCVEANFQTGGSHEGLWGWLYILQQAEDGYAVSSHGMTLGQGHTISGIFQKSADGIIEILMRSGHLPVMYEGAFAQYAIAWDWGAKYTLRDLDSSPSGYWLNNKPSGGVLKAETLAGTLHSYTTFDSSKVDKVDLAIALLKSGELAGPAVAKLPHPAAKGIGTGLTVMGEATSLVVDLAPAFVALSHWDPWPLIDYWRGDVIDTATGIPGVSSAADVQTALAPGFCHGTQCRER
jgi:RHS repeat-associated protein